MGTVIVACGTCGQRFKAPDTAIGRTVGCPQCKNTIEIGAPVPVAPDPESEPPRATAKRGNTGRRTRDEEPQRRGLVDVGRLAGGTADEDTPPPAPRSSGLRESGARRLREEGVRDSQIRRSAGMGESGIRRAHGGGGGRGSAAGPNPKLLLAAGAGVVVLVLAVVGVIVASNNAAERTRIETAKAEEKAEQARKKKADADRRERYERESRDTWEEAQSAERKLRRDRDLEADEELPQDSDLAKLWVRAAQAAANANDEDRARKANLRAAAADPESKDAQLALGRGKYQKPQTEAATRLDLEGLLAGLDEFDGKWHDQAKLEEIRATEARLLREGKAELDAQASDPYRATVAQVRRNIKAQPVLNRLTFLDKRSDPYLVFEEANPNRHGLVDPESGKRLDEKLAMLQQLLAFFEREYAQPYGLTRETREPLRVIALSNRSTFEEYNKACGTNTPVGTLAYYTPLNKWIVLYAGAIPGHSEETKAINDGTVFHEGTHQLVDAYVNRGRGDQDRIMLSRWFDEALAEYHGSVRQAGPGRWDICQLNRHRLQELYQWRVITPAQMQQAGLKCPPLTLSVPEMVTCFTYQDVMRIMLGKVPDRATREALAQRAIVSIVYATAVNFVYFCKTYEGGKYAKNLEAYQRWEWGLDPANQPPTRKDLEAMMRGQPMPKSQKEFNELMEKIQGANPGASCAKAFERAFTGVDMKKLEAEFWAWVNPLIAQAVGR